MNASERQALLKPSEPTNAFDAGMFHSDHRHQQGGNRGRGSHASARGHGHGRGRGRGRGHGRGFTCYNLKLS